MYGDTEVMRKRAGDLREQAVDLRALADRLVGRAEAAAWSGRAAEAMRQRIRERAVALRETADRHETAAETLERHAAEVDLRKDLIAATEARATALVEEARARVARSAWGDAGGRSAGPGGGEPAGDPVDVRLAAFEAPPPGHRDWLTVELPGLATGWTGRP